MERQGWIVLTAGTLMSLAAGTAIVGAQSEDECKPFERIHYRYDNTTPVAGDLEVEIHVEGFVDFRDCEQVRDRLLEYRVRYTSEGGAYHLKVKGATFQDEYVLTPRGNETRWYDGREIRSILYSGVSENAEVSSNEVPLPPPPAAIRVAGKPPSGGAYFESRTAVSPSS